MSDIKPTEAELQAAQAIMDSWIDLDPDTARLSEIIASHTRYEGKTAEEWAEEFRVAMLLRDGQAAEAELNGKRAEAADARIAQLKQDCAEAAEAALQAAPDYEAMHTMVRAAIMQVGNR
jgi:hypothetical protein